MIQTKRDSSTTSCGLTRPGPEELAAPRCGRRELLQNVLQLRDLIGPDSDPRVRQRVGHADVDLVVGDALQDLGEESRPVLGREYDDVRLAHFVASGLEGAPGAHPVAGHGVELSIDCLLYTSDA